MDKKDDGRPERVKAIRRGAVWIGIAILCPSLVLLALAMVGALDAEILAVGGASGVKVVGACAVIGCLVTASGYWGD